MRYFMIILILLSLAAFAENETANGTIEPETMVTSVPTDSGMAPPPDTGSTNMPAEPMPIGVVDHDPNAPTMSPRSTPGNPGMAPTMINATEVNGTREIVAHRQGGPVMYDGEEPDIERERIRAQVQTIKTEMEQTRMMAQAGEGMLMKQAHVRTVTQSLHKMVGIVGGKNLTEVANHFNESVKKMAQAEEKLQKRSGFARFFAGGDRKVAEEIDEQLGENIHKLQKLRNVEHFECADCDPEVKAMLNEQIQALDQEQTRLRTIAEEERDSKGLLGWLWKWG